jgi:glycosyltransferase involved in cell wall biosynthesis
MRVAHFVHRYPPALGGSESYFARLSRWLVRSGDQVTVVTTTALDLESFWSPFTNTLRDGTAIEDGVHVRRHGLLRWPARRWFLKPLSLLPWPTWQCLTLPCNPIAPGMWRAAGRGEPTCDLVHASAFPYAFPIASGLRLARRIGVPFLLTPFLHLGDPDRPDDPTRAAYTAPPMQHLLAAADRVFAQTERERQAIVELGVPAERVVRCGLGVEPAECTGGRRVQVRRRWAIAPDQVVVGHLANQSEEKGTCDLLRAANELWRRGLRFAVVLAGPEMPNFRRFWNAFRPFGRIERVGVLEDRELADFYAGLDLFALPSRSDSFGLVLLEAWANGLPNVAYRAGGPAEVIVHEHDGLLARCGDLADLAVCLARLIESPDLRRDLGERGQQRTATEFRWDDKLARVREVYAEVVESARSRTIASPLTRDDR